MTGAAFFAIAALPLASASAGDVPVPRPNPLAPLAVALPVPSPNPHARAAGASLLPIPRPHPLVRERTGVTSIPLPRPKAIESAAAPALAPIPRSKPASVLARAAAPAPARASDRDTVLELCRKIADKLSSVGAEECMARGLGLSGARSVHGTAILVKEYPPHPGKAPRARVLVVGGIHGDEYSSVSVVFKWLALLDRHHAGLFHWRIAPLMNPDGLLRRDSQRTNANGVDLNRNFPTPNWVAESRRYWIYQTGRNPRRFPGLAPMSEPESRWLVAEIEAFKPDAIIATHAPHGVVDFDGPPHGPLSLGRLTQKLLGTFPGSLGNYAGVQRRLPVVTIELASAGIMPAPREVRQIWEDLVVWLETRFPESGRQAELRADASRP